MSILCNNEEVVMSDQNASSWGYFLAEECRWDVEALKEGHFPVRLLPSKILRSKEIAGHLAYEWFGIPVGTTVGTIYILLLDSQKLLVY